MKIPEGFEQVIAAAPAHAADLRARVALMRGVLATLGAGEPTAVRKAVEKLVDAAEREAAAYVVAARDRAPRELILELLLDTERARFEAWQELIATNAKAVLAALPAAGRA